MAIGGNGGTASFQFGKVLSRGFAIFFSNLVPFGTISLVVFLPYFMLIFVAYQDGVPRERTTISAWTNAVSLLLSYIVTAAIAYGVFNAMRGRRVATGDCLNRGLAVMFPVIGVAVLTAVSVLLGFVALIIPGLFLITILWVAVPVAVVERPGVIDSMKRSAALTEGFRWQVFGIIVALAAINAGVGLVLFLIVGSILSGVQTQDTSAVIGVYLSIAAVDALLTALSAVMTAVGYHDLRAAKEGISIEDIAKVFD